MNILAKALAVAIAAVSAIILSGCTVPVSTTSDQSKDFSRSEISDATVAIVAVLRALDGDGDA